MKMNGKPKMIAIEIMAGKGKKEGMGYDEPADDESYEEEDESEGEATHWKCPDCDTEVMATMDKKSMKCPCCGCAMEKVED
jgi:rubrerythrin